MTKTENARLTTEIQRLYGALARRDTDPSLLALCAILVRQLEAIPDPNDRPAPSAHQKRLVSRALRAWTRACANETNHGCINDNDGGEASAGCTLPPTHPRARTRRP